MRFMYIKYLGKYVQERLVPSPDLCIRSCIYISIYLHTYTKINTLLYKLGALLVMEHVIFFLVNSY